MTKRLYLVYAEISKVQLLTHVVIGKRLARVWKCVHSQKCPSKFVYIVSRARFHELLELERRYHPEGFLTPRLEEFKRAWRVP